MTLDAIDIKIVDALIDDGRASVETVAERIQLSATATRRRIRRLEKDDIITGYRADINAQAAGLEIRIHVLVKLLARDRASIEMFENIVRNTPEIQACDLVTGQFDYFLLIHLPTMKDYHRYLRQFLKDNEVVGSVESNVVIGNIKRTPQLPLVAKD